MAVLQEITTNVYPTEDMGQLSIHDMLTYFEQMGTMRVSDLHLKVGAPPMYRVDGDLEKQTASTRSRRVRKVTDQEKSLRATFFTQPASC